MSIALRLKQARIEAGLSQRRAGMEAKVEQNSIWRYEAGRRVPSPTILNRLALAYGKSLDWFLEEGETNEGNRTSQKLISYANRKEVIYNEVLNALNGSGIALSEQSKISIATYARYVAFIEMEEGIEEDPEDRTSS